MSDAKQTEYLTHAMRLDVALQAAPVDHPHRELLETAARLLADAAKHPGSDTGHDNTRVALIDRDYHWQPIDSHTPRGAKMQLINRKYGVAIYGTIGSHEEFFTHCAPLPTFND